VRRSPGKSDRDDPDDAGEYDVDPGLEATVRIVRSLLDGDDDTGE